MIRMAESETRSSEAPPLSGSASDARLVEDVRRGDHSAFEDLVKRYENRLIGVLLRFVRDRELARDLAQETFLRFMSGWISSIHRGGLDHGSFG